MSQCSIFIFTICVTNRCCLNIWSGFNHINNMAKHIACYSYQESDNMTRLCLIIIGVLIIAVIPSSQDWGEQLGEELVYSRPVRSSPERAKRGKEGKNKRKNRKKSRKIVSRKKIRAVSNSCFDQAVTIMRMWKDIISNFEKQKKRMEKQNGTGGSKSGKKGAFKGVYQKLLSAGGGDKTSLTCAGSSDSPGAGQLTNLTSTLSSCQSDISSACDPASWPQPNMTKLMMCSELATRFKTGAQECLDLSIGPNKTDTDTACGCWTNSSLAQTVEASKDCKFSTEAKGGTQSRKT